MGLPLPLAGAASLFTEQVVAFDATFTRVGGRWVKVIGVNRTIVGVVQTEKAREVSLEGDGALSVGSLMLHTRATIFVADLSQEGGENSTQTYIIYANDQWKVNRYAMDWNVKTEGYEKYFLTKYTNIDE